jgi:UDP-N-acetylglucosamine 2-epimerase (non-hydrolysing)
MGINRKKILIVLGTRPEAIKMAPVIRAARQSIFFEPVTCSTGQHRQLLDQVFSHFGIEPDLDLQLMQKNQDLYQSTSACLVRMKNVLEEIKPSVVLVQGDTTTAFTCALAAFYFKVPVGHVEAGLRTWDRAAPFPEEGFRRMISEIADFHFAPTAQAAKNLINENVPTESVYLTGNTGVDALLWAREKDIRFPELEKLFTAKKLILMTAHRRENFGRPLENIFNAVKKFAINNPEFQIIYPVHPNPNVVEPAHRILGNLSNVALISPVGYHEMVFLLRNCHLVLSDSGGLQEEAPTFGKPVLVFRETTERPEAVAAGCARLVGSAPEVILDSLAMLSSETSQLYRDMSSKVNPFGDGTASQKIINILEQKL